MPESTWRRSPTYDDGPALLSATLDQGLEGVVAKRTSSRYEPGERSGEWAKLVGLMVVLCAFGALIVFLVGDNSGQPTQAFIERS